MALINCSECGKEVSDKAGSCPHCGNPMRSSSSDAVDYNTPRVVKTAKSRGTYIILGLLFGLLGIHNFYAGRYMVGTLQLLITLILGAFVVGLVITFVWVLIDLFTVTQDGAGDAFA